MEIIILANIRGAEFEPLLLWAARSERADERIRPTDVEEPHVRIAPAEEQVRPRPRVDAERVDPDHAAP